MSQRKSWNPQEDHILKQAVLSYSKSSMKIRWSEIAKQISSLGSLFSRSGKQCRERWLNHLKFSGSSLHVENSIDIEMLLRLIRQNGKKWALVVKEFPGRSENNIKNFFYSSLRKGLKSLAIYNKTVRALKIYKIFDQNIVRKALMIHEGGNMQEIMVLKSEAVNMGQRIIQNLLRCSAIGVKDKLALDYDEQNVFESLNKDIAEFSKLCKFKKRQKRQNQQSQDFVIKDRRRKRSRQPLENSSNSQSIAYNIKMKKSMQSKVLSKQKIETNVRFNNLEINSLVGQQNCQEQPKLELDEIWEKDCQQEKIGEGTQMNIEMLDLWEYQPIGCQKKEKINEFNFNIQLPGFYY